MRVMTITALMALSVLSSAAHALDKAAPEALSPKAPLRQSYTAEESAALAAEARQKSDALERARDRRMREISKGICIGC